VNERRLGALRNINVLLIFRESREAIHRFLTSFLVIIRSRPPLQHSERPFGFGIQFKVKQELNRHAEPPC
jgi:hypothetical protein